MHLYQIDTVSAAHLAIHRRFINLMMHTNSCEHHRVKIWWHALRLCFRFSIQLSNGNSVHNRNSSLPGTVNNSGHWLLAPFRTTHWPSKSDLITLINDQCLMLSCHWRGRSSNGHSLVNYWNHIHSHVATICIIIQWISNPATICISCDMM